MIDSHCHLDHEPLINNLSDVITRSKAAGVNKILTQFVQQKKVTRIYSLLLNMTQ